VHPFIEAALALKRAAIFSAEDVVAIHVRCGKGADLVCQPTESKQHPRNLVDAQFSACWGIAAALARGRVAIDAYSEPALQVEELRRLAAMATIEIDERLSRMHEVDAVEISVLLRDGRRLRRASGEERTSSMLKPLEIAIDKLQGRLGATDIIDAVGTLEGQPNLERLTSLLFRQTAQSP
jgi:2-methylcitrate dehydratase PrpD